VFEIIDKNGTSTAYPSFDPSSRAMRAASCRPYLAGSDYPAEPPAGSCREASAV
jgi:hypothetical protein